jgi:hypothetical protein
MFSACTERMMQPRHRQLAGWCILLLLVYNPILPISAAEFSADDDIPAIKYIREVWLPKHNSAVAKIDAAKKYVSYRVYNRFGLGNKLMGLVSCFLLAILTDRAFVIECVFATSRNE